MKSRMDKYYARTKQIKSRSSKNQSLYDSIYDEVEYSNIEGIASIEKTNRIDLSQIQELLKKSEKANYLLRQDGEKRDLNQSQVAVDFLEHDEEKNYDIRDVLNEAKIKREKIPNENRQMTNTQFDILKKLNIDETTGETELKELIHTITNTSLLNKLEDEELSLSLLSSLKGSGETIISDKPLIDDEVIVDEFDKSFFTSNLNFKNEDFEDIKENLKKNNILIKVLTFLLVVVIFAGAIYIIYNLPH